MKSLTNKMVIVLGVLGSVLMSSTLFAGEAVDVRVLQDAPERIIIKYEIDRFGEQAVKIDGVSYTQLSLGRESLMQVKGAPSLPNVYRSVIIPDDARMAVRVLKSQHYDIPNILVAPSKGPIPRSQSPKDVPYEFGKVYDVDAFYPAEVVRLREPYILRDYRGVVVEFNAFQYNPVTETLRVHTAITVEVVTVGVGKANVLASKVRRHKIVRSFDGIYKSHFLNYVPETRYAPLDETGDMLIIYHDAWLANIQPLVDHKNAIGITTTAVGVSAIGNNSTSIAAHIQNEYDTGDLAFVLLVGDASEVDTPSSAGGSADPTYALVAGSDHYPDIFVGRFSAQTAAQVDTQVLRTIEYEELPATTQDWFKRGVGIASAEGGPGQGDDDETDIEHMDNIRTDLLGYGYDPVNQIYDPGASASSVTTAVNAGRGIINYVGHGSTTAWSTTGFSNTNVNALTNDNMLPFIVSVACVNGKFDGYTCFAEAWLRATHVSEPTGAIAMYASSINQSWASPMCGQDEIVDLLVAEGYFSFGALCFAGSCQMMDEYGADGQNMFDTWHVFGDPSVRVYGATAPPSGLKVTPSSGLASEGPHGGPFTPDSVVYTLENQDDTGLNYTVTKTAAWVSLDDTGGYLPGHGTTEVTVSINSSADSLPNGHYEDTVEFINTTDHDGDTTRPVSLDVGVPVAVYSFPMDSDPGWSTEDQWAFGTPTGNGGEYGGPDPTSGHTGNYVYGYNLSGDYANYLPERHLTTTAIDCTDLSQVSLEFWRWLGVEQSAYDHAYVRVSNNGTSWTTVWQNGATISDSSWTQQECDISEVADGQPTVYLRWTMGTTDVSWRYCGWNIDDVEIWGINTAEPVPGDYNHDGEVDLNDFAYFDGCMTGPENGPAPAECEAFYFDADDDVDLADFAAFQMAIAG